MKYEGKTASGRTLRIEGDKPYGLRVWIDGEWAEIADPRHDIQLFRDGGTMTITTKRGFVRLPHRLGNPDHRPLLDGEIVEPPF